MAGSPLARIGLLTCAAVLLAGACTDSPARNKTGNRIVVLRFATIDSLNPNGQIVAPTAFIHAVEQRSSGLLKVVVQQTFGDGAPDAESKLVTAIAAGDLDGGWPSSRAFAAAGIKGFAALEAPLLLTNYQSAAAITMGAAAQTLLSSIGSSEIVGLGLATGPLRRMFADRPLLAPADWTGVTVRSYNSPVQDATYRSLGAKPVEASWKFPELVRSGDLHAAETDIAQYASNNYGPLLPVAMRNVVWWPKTIVFALSRGTWDRLDGQERSWLRSAAGDATRAAAAYTYDESTPATKLCQLGVRFIDATPTQVAALRRAVKPVIDQLGTDTVTAASMSAVAAIAAHYPDVDIPQVPASCRRSTGG